MAIKCTGFDLAYSTASFVADTTADINNADLPSINQAGSGDFANLPAISMGSDITVISPSQVYMLNSEGSWIQL